MKKFNVEIKHYDAFESKTFSVILPDYMNNASVRDIVYPVIKGRYGYSIHVFQSSLDTPPTDTSVESLLHSVKSTKLWSRKVKKVYSDELIEVPIEIKKFHLPKHFKVSDSEYAEGLAFVPEGITFFQLSVEWPYVGIVKALSDKIMEELGCKMSRNGFYYLHDEWKFEQDKEDETLWRAMRTEMRKKLKSVEITYKQL